MKTLLNCPSIGIRVTSDTLVILLVAALANGFCCLGLGFSLTQPSIPFALLLLIEVVGVFANCQTRVEPQEFLIKWLLCGVAWLMAVGIFLALTISDPVEALFSGEKIFNTIFSGVLTVALFLSYFACAVSGRYFGGIE